MNEKYSTHDHDFGLDAQVQFLDDTSTTDDIRNEIMLLGDRLAHHSRETFSTLALVTDAIVMASPDVEDKKNSAAAQAAFLKGTMSGLYVTKELLGDKLSPEAVIASIKTLGVEDDRGIVSNVGLMQESEKQLAQMHTKTRAILERWALACGSKVEDVQLFKLGFGLTMGGASRANYEVNVIRQLEEMSGWESALDQNNGMYLESVDEDCRSLACSFEQHAAFIGLSNEPSEEMRNQLIKVNQLLERDFGAMKEVKIDTRLQTRGVGLYIGFDERGAPCGVFGVDDDIRIRGTLIGTECLPVPTDYALITQAMNDEKLYEPLVCLLLDNVEVVEAGGLTLEHEGVVALPLRVDGVRVDRIMTQIRTDE